jgi:hypothetical protein
MPYSDIIESFPEEIRSPMYRLLERLREEAIQSVRRSDFEELKGIVHTLGERVHDLAEAQGRTEVRLEELAEAQRRTEVRLGELAEAQRRTEVRLEELVEAQRQLTDAQRRTEGEVRELTKGLRETREMVGGLSHTIGYGLEDRALPLLPALLRSDLGVQVQKLVRRFVILPDGSEEGVNIYGKGEQQGRQIVVMGEAKAQLGRRDVDRFVRKVDRIRKGLDVEVVPLVLTYSVPPRVEQYAKSKGLAIYWSYDLQS